MVEAPLFGNDGALQASALQAGAVPAGGAELLRVWAAVSVAAVLLSLATALLKRLRRRAPGAAPAGLLAWARRWRRRRAEAAAAARLDEAQCGGGGGGGSSPLFDGAPLPPPTRWLSDDDGDGGGGAQQQQQQQLRRRAAGAARAHAAPLLFWPHQADGARTPPGAARDPHWLPQHPQPPQDAERRPFSFRAPGPAAAPGPPARGGGGGGGGGAAGGAGAWGSPASEPESPGWDPDLLQRCAELEDEISSVEGLQRSPLFRGHVRSKGLTYEMASAHRLRIYRALLRADPEGFAALLTRRDVREYEQAPPGRATAALEALVSGAASAAALLLPALAAAPPPAARAAAGGWLLLTLLAAGRGSGSPLAWLLGIFQTRGPYGLPAAAPWVAALALLDAGFAAATCGLGALPNAAFRLAGGQGVLERLMGLSPTVERARPARVAAAPPRGGGRGGAVTPRRLSG
ncbi:MAG: hypothetical protein J3K34DRAFT_460510 [Monoraphidium minutum]|nr:MAG: hypothetical protein J3K34DRAFT_460510 [Monoraphidium minutum]